MTHQTALSLHILVGTIALAGYWIALSSRKGTTVHRLAGKFCLASLIFVALSVGPVLFGRPGPFDPGWIVQMIYLTTCLVTVSMLSITAIRYRNAPELFRNRAFRTMGFVLLAMGSVVLLAGIVTADPVAVTLSWVGLVFGPAMIAFARYKGDLHRKWWLSWHLNANCALFNAVNGTVLFVAARWLGVVDDAVGAQVGFQILTMAAALALRLWFGARFGAPIRFGPANAAPEKLPRAAKS